MLLVILCTSQLPDNVVKATSSAFEKDILFSKLSSSALISSNAVFSISKDNYGYMWFGTRGGLYRCDGVESKELEGLSDESIRSVYKDSSGILWVGTKYGLNSIDVKTGIITKYLHNDNNPYSISSNIIWSVFEDSRNTLWFGTTEGLNTLDRETGNFTAYTHDPNDSTSISNNIVRAIYEDNQVYCGLERMKA